MSSTFIKNITEIFSNISIVLLHIYFLYRTLDTKITLKKQILVSFIFVFTRLFYYNTTVFFRPYVSAIACIIYASIMFVGRFNEYVIWSVIAIVLDGIVEVWVIGLYILIPSDNVKQVAFYGDMHIFVVIASKIVLFFLYYLVTKKIDKSAEISFEYSILIIAFPVGCWVMIYVLFIYEDTLTAISKMPVMFIIGTVFLIMMVCVIKLYNSIVLQTRELTKSKLELLRSEMSQQHIDQIKDIYENLSRLRHDLSNHFSIITTYIDAKEFSSLKIYVENLVDFKFDMFPYSNNFVINTLISSAVEKAKKQNIDFDASIKLPENITISDVDFCIVLSNVLDNAFDANKTVEGEKYIDLNLYVEEAYWRIDCYNPTTNPNNFKSGNALKTSKDDIENHGIGTKQICDIVKKTGGFVTFNCENYEFSTTVMIKL